MSRLEQIFEVCSKYISVQPHPSEYFDILNAIAEKAFIAGAQWADDNPKSTWISVKERLPEPEKEVIVLFKDKSIDIDFLTDDGEKNYYWWKSDEAICCDDDEITHWMPIPKLPKE